MFIIISETFFEYHWEFQIRYWNRHHLGKLINNGRQVGAARFFLIKSLTNIRAKNLRKARFENSSSDFKKTKRKKIYLYGLRSV